MNFVIRSFVYVLLVSLSGCSAVWEEVTYFPTESKDWIIEGETSQIIGSLGAKYFCGDVEISVPQVVYAKNEFWGPPLIPFIPSLEKHAPYLLIEIRGTDRAISCPDVKASKMRIAGHKRLGTLPWQFKTTLCEYAVIPENDFYLEIASMDVVKTCPLEPLKFKWSSRWRYSPFIMPKT